MSYSIDEFVADLRRALQTHGPTTAGLEAGALALSRLLANPAAFEPYRSALDAGPGPWLLYADETWGFVVTLLRKPRGQTTPVHHHGEAWTLYGILAGSEQIYRYERLDDETVPGQARITLAAEHRRRAGETEVEPGYAIHNETTGDERDTIAVAVRGRDLGRTPGEWFDLDRGTVETRLGKAATPIGSGSY
jgi:predicted metal-dependent enzyme (double-stranded beta helix superfamily)